MCYYIFKSLKEFLRFTLGNTWNRKVCNLERKTTKDHVLEIATTTRPYLAFDVVYLYQSRLYIYSIQSNELLLKPQYKLLSLFIDCHHCR